jgi:hypothetical protein
VIRKHTDSSAIEALLTNPTPRPYCCKYLAYGIYARRRVQPRPLLSTRNRHCRGGDRQESETIVRYEEATYQGTTRAGRLRVFEPFGRREKRELRETPRRLWAARPFSFAVDQGGAGVGFMHQGSSNVGWTLGACLKSNASNAAHTHVPPSHSVGLPINYRK